MIGCMPENATSEPLTAPTAAPASERDRDRRPGAVAEVQRQQRGAIAMAEPTDRSMPSVAMTSAIPIATIATGTTCTSCRRRLATVAKFGVKTQVEDQQQRDREVDAVVLRASRSDVGAAAPRAVRVSVIAGPPSGARRTRRRSCA